MTELLTAAQMRAIEQAAIESGEVTGLELMERAGRGAVEAILAEWRELASGERRAVVLCGPGNNGGDGFVVARLLRERGWAVEAFLYGDANKLPPDARVNYERWVGMGEIFRADLLEPEGRLADLYIDALFGTGLTRPVINEGLERVAAEIEDDRAKPPYLVSIDVVSGLDADSGRPLGMAHSIADAHLTVTFHSAKLGHYLEKGPVSGGRLRVVGIGLDGTHDPADKHASASFHGLEPSSVERGVGSNPPAAICTLVGYPMVPPHRLLKHSGHKFDHGHALVLSGGVGRGGAARMAARGALRIGAGLVTLACPPAAVIENAARLDAIMLRPVKDAGALAAMLEDSRLNALCLGPGLGTREREAALVRVALGGEPVDSGAAGRDGVAEGRGPGSEAGASSGRGRDDGAGGHGAPGSTPGLDPQSATAASAEGVGAHGSGGGVTPPSVSRDTPEDRGSGSGAGALGKGEGRPAPDVSPRTSDVRRATVLDGDALTILARSPALFALVHDRCVLTPHAGEFARLFPDLAERLDAPAETGPAYSKVDAARDAAARAGCVVLLKGPDTVIAHPDGRAAVNSAHYERSAPWLATAGAGDVLAGFVAGLLARGLEPMQAAEAAAWLHVECALEFGPGLIAEDLPEQLPKVFRRLGV